MARDEASANGTAWTPLRIAQWVVVIGLVIASEVVAHRGHLDTSYGLDVAAILAYVGFRLLRR